MRVWRGRDRAVALITFKRNMLCTRPDLLLKVMPTNQKRRKHSRDLSVIGPDQCAAGICIASYYRDIRPPRVPIRKK
jgi:hypothetical protein